MAYIKYKEISKYFDFSKYIETEDLPQYVIDYVFEEEQILVTYKTFRDYGVFTDSKIILFDNAISINPYKEIFIIPYSKVSSCSIVFRPSKVELKFDLESGYQLRLKFINMKVVDKVRLRLLYSCISRIIDGQDVPKTVMNKLIENKIVIKED